MRKTTAPKNRIDILQAYHLSKSQPSYLYTMLTLGTLTGVKVDGKWWIDVDSFEEWLAKRRRKSGTPRKVSAAQEEPVQMSA